jgi:hypothetical protein
MSYKTIRVPADLSAYAQARIRFAAALANANANDPGKALLSLAAERQVDLLVMGAYGHTRFREFVLGGVTRIVLQSMTVPVFMTH